MATPLTRTSEAQPTREDLFVERDRCPACDGARLTEIYTADLLDPNIRVYLASKIREPAMLESFRGVSYTLLKCGSCGLVFQHNILSDDHLPQLYAEEWMPRAYDTAAELFAYNANELWTIRSLFDKPVRDVRVLDFGLGTARWAKVAKAIGFDVYGTDLIQSLLDDARLNGIKTLSIDEIANHQFDFINTEQVFEHLPRPGETLAELTDRLRPGGIIKISVPDGRDIEKRLPMMDWSAPRHSKRFLIPVTPLVHINTFDYDVIRRIGEHHGLRAVEPKLRQEYWVIDASSPKNLGRSLLRPIARRLRRRAYALLKKPAAEAG